MTLFQGLVALSIGSALIFWLFFCYRGPSLAKSIIKPVPMMALAVACFVDGLSPWLVAGLVLSAVGDFALSRPGNRSFAIGLGAFAAAHIAYIGLFTLGGSGSMTLPPLWIWVVVVGLAVLTLGLVVPRAGQLKAAIVGYVVLICIMVLTSGLYTHRASSPLDGALAFAASDFILGLQLFRTLPRWADVTASVLIWMQYYLGQLLIAMAVAVMAW